jgi:hypothetical protein
MRPHLRTFGLLLAFALTAVADAKDLAPLLKLPSASPR